MKGQVPWLGAAAGAAVGLGDGLVGKVPIVDKYSNVHTVYRLGVGLAALLAAAAGANQEACDGALAGATALLASRIPAAVGGGGWQQFGYTAEIPSLPAPGTRLVHFQTGPAG